MAAIRALLSAAFRGKDLWQFCQGQPAFRPVLDRVNSDPPLEDIVDVLMEYCLKQALFGELLAEIKDVNPRQYERFEPQLFGNNAWLWCKWVPKCWRGKLRRVERILRIFKRRKNS